MGLNNMSYKPFFKETENWRDYPEEEGEDSGTEHIYEVGDKFKDLESGDTWTIDSAGLFLGDQSKPIYQLTNERGEDFKWANSTWVLQSVILAHINHELGEWRKI